MKKIFSILLTAILVAAICATVVYAEEGTGELGELVSSDPPTREVVTIATLSENTYDPNDVDAPEWLYVTDENTCYVKSYDYTEGTYKYVKEDELLTEGEDYTKYELTFEDVTTDDGVTLKVTSTAAFSDFVSVSIDGHIVDAKNYTVEEGSTVVTFTVAYYSTLTDGVHEVAVNSTNGYAKDNFTIGDTITTGDDADTNVDGEDSQTQSPQTGDTSNLTIWILVAAVAFTGLVVLINVASRAQKRNNE